MKAILDTSIYISHYRAGLHHDWIHRVNTEYTLSLHAVVLAELNAGAQSSAFIKELRCLEKVFETRDRIIIPQKKDYLSVGRVLKLLREKEKADKVRLKTLFADVLLAVSVRDEGMLLVTEDEDFELIKKVLPFKLLLLQPFH